MIYLLDPQEHSWSPSAKAGWFLHSKRGVWCCRHTATQHPRPSKSDICRVLAVPPPACCSHWQLSQVWYWSQLQFQNRIQRCCQSILLKPLHLNWPCTYHCTWAFEGQPSQILACSPVYPDFWAGCSNCIFYVKAQIVKFFAGRLGCWGAPAWHNASCLRLSWLLLWEVLLSDGSERLLLPFSDLELFTAGLNGGASLWSCNCSDTRLGKVKVR